MTNRSTPSRNTYTRAAKGHVGLAACCLLSLPAAAIPSLAGAAERAPETAALDEGGSRLAEMSLQELMDIEVTSVSHRPEKASAAAAAVFVITADDIRRSGMTSLPDILRLAPGVNVAQAHNGQWAVSIRGFNDAYSSKLLVLVDGRPIYSAAYAGVLWFMQDMPLEDIERIEVIRGPGAAVWGANAVNGVINIITKPAEETQGALVSLTGGGRSRDHATLGFGGKISDTAAYRIYVKGGRDQGLRSPTGADGGDPLRQIETGFRLDWAASDRDQVTAAGQYMAVRTRVTTAPLGAAAVIFPPQPGGTTGPIVVDERDQSWFLQVAWERTLTNGAFSTQAYLQRDRIGQVGGVLRMTTAEAEARYHFALGQRQDVVLGAGYRQRDYSTTDGALISISATAPIETLKMVSLFGQDSISLTDKLTLTAGAKVEHITETGWEFEPSLRLAWAPSPNHTVWAAASRAIRSPSIGDRGLRLLTPVADATVPTFLVNLGDPNAKSETEVSYELGYRVMLSPRINLDIAAYASRYDHLLGFVIGAPYVDTSGPFPVVLIPAQARNLAKGRTHGVEISATWRPTDTWRLSGSYSSLSMRTSTPAANIIPDLNNDPGKSPRGQYQLHSALDLPHDLEFDVALFHTTRLAVGPIPAYTRLDVRLGWRPTEHLEIALVGQNLLKDHHPEITPMVLRGQEDVPRTVFAQLRARF